MSYSNLDSYVSFSLEKTRSYYNIEFFTNQIYKITNNENQRISLYENGTTSGILKQMNDIQFEITKDENDIYHIVFSVNSIQQDPIVLPTELSEFRLPLYLSVMVQNTEITFRTFMDIKFSENIETVYNNPNSYGFIISFSKTRIRNMLNGIGGMFMIETTFIIPPIYTNETNCKLIKKTKESVSSVGGKLLFNIIRCV